MVEKGGRFSRRIAEGKGRLLKLNPVHVAIAERISQGECLLTRDCVELFEEHGYNVSRKQYTFEIVPSRFEAETGVSIKTATYKGMRIYFDPRIVDLETSIQEAKRRIDLARRSKK